MKSSVIQKIALSLVLLASPFTVMAKNSEEAYVESYRGRSDVPVPVSVVKPEVSPRHAGQVVELEFIVDSTGKPGQIKARSSATDLELVEALTVAVARWQFTPAIVDGKPVARKVMLPLRIVNDFSGGTQIAAK